MTHFNTVQEVVEATLKVCDWPNDVIDSKRYETINDLLENSGIDFRLFALEQGWTQFERDINWSDLHREDWVLLLSKQPQYAEYCDWESFSDFDWQNLLAKQPQLASFVTDEILEAIKNNG